jgi:rhodanese-related sulfurtransferase
MKITKYILLLAISAVMMVSCTQSYAPGKDIQTVKEDTINVPEIEALLRFINNSNDFINSKDSPSLVSADDVYDNLGKYYIIDIRKHESYVNGHISGAVNVSMPNVINHLDRKVAPSVYEKIVIVCNSGQSSAYTTSVLRLLGYSNAYSMKYGMSSWNKSLDKWSSKISSKYIGKLETKVNPVEGMHPYPAIQTGKHCGAEILEARARTLLNTPFQKLKISADRVFKNLDEFYIINFWPIDRYEVGHIPGAYQYTPHKDLNSKTLLNTIPDDKKILVYDYTGQTSAFVVAYLRLLGYNAFTMYYGANSFMYNTLKLRNWNAFVAANKVNDFPLVKGENPTDKAFESTIKTGGSQKAAPKKKIIRRKKKEVEGGCG